jgi:hypothetical protein
MVWVFRPHGDIARARSDEREGRVRGGAFVGIYVVRNAKNLNRKAFGPGRAGMSRASGSDRIASACAARGAVLRDA